MEQSATAQPVLPRDRAFVVQLSAQATGTPEGFRGRVEHVASGQAAHFDSVPEFLAFIVQVLRERRGRPACFPRRPTRPGPDPGAGPET